MKVASELEEAQLEQIVTADEAGAGKESGRIYANSETEEILLGTGAALVRFRKAEDAIGDMKHSMLTEAQFQAEIDSTWILADGRDITGSDFHSLTGFTIVPDCRGQFLRGANNTRADGEENPDGGTVLGDQQTDEFASHNHPTTVSHAFIGGPNGLWGQGSGTNPGTNVVGSDGGLETRPKNITVNIFIKINRLP